MTALTHLTITSGHIATTTRADVTDAVVSALLPLVREEGGPIPGLPGLFCDLWWPLTAAGDRIPGAAVFQVAPGRAGDAAGKLPAVMAVACWREGAEAAAWAQAQQIATMLQPGRALTTPLPVPWLAVAVLPGAALVEPERLAAIADFERCLVWALSEDGAL